MGWTKTTNGWKSVKNRKDVGGAEGVARSAHVPGAADAVICSAHVVCVSGAAGVDGSCARIVVDGAECVGCHARVLAQRRVS